MFDPSLLLSPHVFFLAILFRHRAFLSERLNDNPHILSECAPAMLDMPCGTLLTSSRAGKLLIHPSGNELPLSLKEEMRDQYIFRQTEKTPMGFVMSQNRISQATMSGWVKRIGVLLGFERNTISYNLRYMAGNKMDQNGKLTLRTIYHSAYPVCLSRRLVCRTVSFLDPIIYVHAVAAPDIPRWTNMKVIRKRQRCSS